MNHHGNNKSKIAILALCVVAPVAAMAIFVLNRFGTINVGSYLPYIMFLVCPLSHLFIMPLMHKATNKRDNADENGNKSSCH